MVFRPPDELRELLDCLVAMLRRERELPPQTLRHLEQHVEPEADVRDFLRDAASTLVDYELEIIFGPVFTPTFDERVEVADPLTRVRPCETDIPHIVDALAGTVDSRPVRLESGDIAVLALHEALIERWVTLLRINAAPDPDVVESIRDSVGTALVPIALALLRSRGMTEAHQDWTARFLAFASDRHAIARDFLFAIADFISSQTTFEPRDLKERIAALLKAAIDTGAYVQKGRAYWSPDVAEHHSFRGQGVVDDEELSRRKREIEVLETIKSDVEAFGDVVGLV